MQKQDEPGGKPRPVASRPRGRWWRRQLGNRLALLLSTLAMGWGLFFLGWILWTALARGLAGWGWALLLHSVPAPAAAGGGLANALAGSLLMVALATCIGTPLGLLAGIYLAEYGQRDGRWLAASARFAADMLLSMPSILLGLLVYALVVLHWPGFSGLAGALALALIVVPVVIRSTEGMLRQVPASLREAAHALGAPQWRVVLQVALPAARAGVLTGVLLAVARIAGETAPLLFTALNNQFWSTDMSGPMASLPVTIFQFAMSPYANWQQLAWAGVLLIVLLVLGLNVLARWLTRNKETA